MSGLTETEYDDRAHPELLALRDAIDALDDDDVDADLEAGILTLEFSDDDRFVINSHRAARQIWMAAGREAWHFDWDPGVGQWVATRTGAELWATLARRLSDKLGKPVVLRP